MSVSSPNPSTTGSEFSELLAKHPELAQTIAQDALQEPAMSQQGLHDHFLEACTHCGISNEEYPFTIVDRGQAALLDYYGQLQLPQRPMALPSHAPTAADETLSTQQTTDVGADSSRPTPIYRPRNSAVDEGTPGTTTTIDDIQAETDLSSPREIDQSIETLPILVNNLTGGIMVGAPLAGALAQSSPHEIEQPTEIMPVLVNNLTGGIMVGAPLAGVLVETSPTPSKMDPSQTPPQALPTEPAVPAKRRPLSKRRRIISLVLLGILLLSILIPIGIAISYGISAYNTYNDLRNQAHSGVQHLLNVKTIFTAIKTHPTGFFDADKLHHAQKELLAAHNDFQQLQYKLNHTPIIHTITSYFPQYLTQVQTAQAASQIGIDISDIGQELTASALILAPTFRGPLLTNTSKPLVTQDMLNLIGVTIDDTLPRLSDIQAQTHSLSLNALPVSAQQRDQFQQLVQAIPQAEADLLQVRNLLGVANWVLGVDAPRTFLVQTMDRAELRPTGGFTGQYGELQISGGRIAPFVLHDISLVEYTNNSPTADKLAPQQYRSWWPFANWGLRDSNVSADFPTSAQIAIHQYGLEVGHQVDGVILFTPFLVEHILQIIGPIYMPGYKESITAQNLEERLHYYQQDNAAIAKQVVIQPGVTTTSDRKRFTGLLAHLLMDKVRQAPPDEIVAIAREMLHDLKTKDVQVYFNNPQAEQVLMQYGDAAQLDRSTTHDGLYVVQANLSASKASQYVKTILHDTVTLDATGGATHLLQMRLVYNQLGPVYGYDTYRDYVRVYVPPTSKFLWGDGFDTGKPLCGGAYNSPCPQTGVYPHNELVCPPGLYQPGAQAPSITDPDGGRWRALDTVGPPTNLISDEPGRAMFAGWVVLPKNCTITVTLSWYVPPPGTSPYTLLVQRQAGTFPELDLTILPTPADCTSLKAPGQHFDSILGEDTSFTVKTNATKGQARTNCYPQPTL